MVLLESLASSCKKFQYIESKVSPGYNIEEAFTTSVKSSIRAAGAIQLLIYCMLNAISFGGIVPGMIMLASTGLIIAVKTYPLISVILPLLIVINVLFSLIPTLPSSLMLLMSSFSSITVKTLPTIETLPFCSMSVSTVGSAEPCTDVFETLKLVCEILSVKVRVNMYA